MIGGDARLKSDLVTLFRERWERLHSTVLMGVRKCETDIETRRQ